MKKIAVIGAGLGGLSAACRLARDGHSVTVFEKNDRPGGKVNLVESEGYSFDTGASLVTMKHVFEDLFEYCGDDLEERIELIPLDPICRYFWKDGTRLDASTDLERTQTGIAAFAPGDAGKLGDYLEDSRRKYEIAERTFLARPLNDLSKLLTPSNIPDLFRISSTKTLDSHNRRYFDSEKVRQLFDRYATYNGSSPYRSPATFALIPYAEFGLGAWYPKGGIFRIPTEIEALARRHGTEFRYSEPVEEIVIEGGAVKGVRAGSDFFECDTVVANADAIDTYRRLVPPEHRRKYSDKRLDSIEPSCGGFVLLLGTDRKFDQLAHHNIFFSDDYREEFRAIFGSLTVPEDPTIYICATSRTDPTQAPDGCENLFILLNVPYTGVVDWESEKEGLGDSVIDALEGFGLEGLGGSVVYREAITPEDFETRYRANRGSIYGMSSNGILSAFMRIPNRSNEIKGLYFAGGSTHPGGGMPLVLLSGKFAAEMISEG
ncbi:MAG: phytoene desaturase [Acidobacteria bacterium]|nr:MAG: phytoene desaturase [Acidobacteriota bacterium]REK02771.1 MAG: phytoene desaturase [Acidobacteriota bacterium]REK13424.1 MAG: phytoene desaturase [Acidobacteriota bacterium]REK41418.1 MAG: phytoene desaturase [Acidobacteriota bacterium]